LKSRRRRPAFDRASRIHERKLAATESWIEQRDELLQLDSAALSSDIGLQTRPRRAGIRGMRNQNEFDRFETLPEAAHPERRRKVLVIIAVVLHHHRTAVGAFLAAGAVEARRRTDDAYVNGNKSRDFGRRFSGTVIAVLTDDTQLVKSGQVLVAPGSGRRANGDWHASASALGQSVPSSPPAEG